MPIICQNIVTNGYKGKSIKLVGIFMSFMPIRILMVGTIFALYFNCPYDYNNVKLMPNFAEQKRALDSLALMGTCPSQSIYINSLPSKFYIMAILYMDTF